MRTLQRDGRAATVERSDSPSGDPGSGNLEAIRQSADRLHQAGISAIERALTGDSQTFIEAIRQDQGQ